MNVFLIQYLISAYDGENTIGITTSLEKAVEYLQTLYKKDEEIFVEFPAVANNGHYITEYRLDSFKPVDDGWFYNGEGTRMNWKPKIKS